MCWDFDSLRLLTELEYGTSIPCLRNDVKYVKFEETTSLISFDSPNQDVNYQLWGNLFFTIFFDADFGQGYSSVKSRMQDFLTLGAVIPVKVFDFFCKA